MTPRFHNGCIAALFLSLAALSGCTSMSSGSACSTDMDAHSQALVQLDDQWSKMAATKDADKVSAFYADDAIAYPPNEPMAVGKEAAKKVWAAYFAAPEFAISWKTQHAQISGDLGYTTGTYEDSFKGPDGKTVSEKGKYVCVWKKQTDGSWKAIHDIWNSDAK